MVVCMGSVCDVVVGGASPVLVQVLPQVADCFRGMHFHDERAVPIL